MKPISIYTLSMNIFGLVYITTLIYLFTQINFRIEYIVPISSVIPIYAHFISLIIIWKYNHRMIEHIMIFIMYVCVLGFFTWLTCIQKIVYPGIALFIIAVMIMANIVDEYYDIMKKLNN